MNYRSPLAALSICIALGAVAQTPGANEPIKVFLQGTSAAELSALVESQGGTVTHNLHIIDAVGAMLTPNQLEKVLASGQVGRFFDDLSLSETPEEPDKEGETDCKLHGSVQLDINKQDIHWLIYNKDQNPARLERLTLSWPSQFGRIEQITLGDQILDPKLLASVGESTALIELEQLPADSSLLLNGNQRLGIHFSDSPGQPVQQRDFEVKASFAGDCSVELIPGYDDNHENFHYNAAAGVDALHLNGVTGKGITVAVIDSGLWEDPALSRDTAGQPRIVARYDAITNTTSGEVFDASGHGTHMTSVLAHNGAVTRNGVATGTFKGVAPDVNLVAVKAFDVEGQGDFLDIVRAIQWVVDNRKTYDIRVLNLSFAARPRWHYWQDPINQAVMQAWADGITVVAAAGNEGPELMTIGSPGNLPYVITVGAITDSWTPADRDDDYIPDFSSRGPTPSAHIKPDLVAPGGHMTGLTRPGSTLTLEHPEYILRTGEFVMTGSSQATALVSGVVALLLQLKPDLTPDDVKCMLLTSAEPAINSDGLLAYSPFQQGHGYLNATRAVTLGEIGCGNAELDIDREISGIEHSEGPAIIDKDGKASLPGLSEMVSPEPAAKGMSKTRKWGVKAHIERQNPPPANTTSPLKAPPFDWMQLYLEERNKIESLSRQDPG
ncbi:MAG: S8 family peptidase [Halioglobus sp.]|nr:S8 family peptidase [Halioglobus sp.]